MPLYLVKYGYFSTNSIFYNWKNINMRKIYKLYIKQSKGMVKMHTYQWICRLLTFCHFTSRECLLHCIPLTWTTKIDFSLFAWVCLSWICYDLVGYIYGLTFVAYEYGGRSGAKKDAVPYVPNVPNFVEIIVFKLKA